MKKMTTDFFFRLRHWETWHYLAKYILIMPVWAWYCVRARSPWFFTPSNPGIEFGGFEGETKTEIYSQLPEGSYPRTTLVPNTLSIDELLLVVIRAGLKYPFVVKPNAGMMGLMFRRIDDERSLVAYHRVMHAEYLMQELVEHPLEVSVFYYRYPWSSTGVITGFLKKEFLQVTGDGVSDLRTLILGYDRVRLRIEEMFAKHRDNLTIVLPEGKSYVLSYALNLSRGGRLISLAPEIDDRLHRVFDNLNAHSRHFYYGRYDIRCASVEALKEGRDFSILEYNGCGAEPHHAYGNGNTLFEAYRIFLSHWKILFKISAYNHRHGFPRWNLQKGWKYLRAGKKNFRILKKLDRLHPA